MTIRIGFDGTPLRKQRSGVGYYTERLLASLLDINPSWHYLLYSNRPLGQLEASLKRAHQVESFLPWSRWMWMQFALPRIIQQTQPDLCHFTNASAPLLRFKPFVLTIYDASLFLWRQYHPWSRLLSMALFLPQLARHAAAVVTISEHARDDLVRILRLPEEKIHVVYGAAPTDFQPVRDQRYLAALRHRYNLPDEYLLYVGTIEPRKNLRRLIGAMSNLHDRGCKPKLVMVGASGWMMEDFEKEIDYLGLKEHVQFLGYIPTEDLPGIYSLATLFAFPSLYEGFGLPPLEAMACGTPVLTSKGTAMAEVCGDAAYLIDPKSVEEITHGLWRLLSDRNLQAELSQRGQQRARQFSWRRAARETMTVYDQVLHSTPAQQVSV